MKINQQIMARIKWQNLEIDTTFVEISSTVNELWTWEDRITWWAETRGTFMDALSILLCIDNESISSVNN